MLTRCQVRLLRSHVDVQVTDGQDLLLQYVSSYVSKMKGHDVLYDLIMEDVSGYEIDHKYLGCLKVNVPEMVLEMSDFKPSHTMGLTTKFTAPHPKSESLELCKELNAQN